MVYNKPGRSFKREDGSFAKERLDMGKIEEINFPDSMGDEGREYLYRKPFMGDVNLIWRLVCELGDVIRALRVSPGMKVLDLGAGSGWTSIYLAKCGCDVTGLDISPGMIEIANKRAVEEGVEVGFKVMDIENLDFNEEFDAVLIYDALHHTEKPREVLKGCAVSLKAGGRIVVLEPGLLHPFMPATKKTVEHFGVRERGFTRRGIKKMLRSCGFNVSSLYSRHELYREGLTPFAKTILKDILDRFFNIPSTRLVIVGEKRPLESAD